MVRRQFRKSRSRRGSLAIEFALSAPVLFLFTFAGFEFTRANMIRNSIANAAYEGARTGMVPGATAAQCETASQQLLDTIGVGESTVTVDPPVIRPDSPTVSVTIDVPMTAANGYVTPRFYLGKTLSATVVLPRELSSR